MGDEKISQTYLCIRRSKYISFFQVGHALIELDTDLPISREDGEKKAMGIAMSNNSHLTKDGHHIDSTLAIFPNDKKGREKFLNYAIDQDNQDWSETITYEEMARSTLEKYSEEK